MRDFNFFSPFLQEKRNKRQRTMFLIAVSSLIIIGLLSFTALNIYQIFRYKHEIDTVESYMKSKKTIEMLGKYSDTTKKLELTRLYYDKASQADKFLKSSNTVSTALLDKLSSVMTQDSTISNLAINNNIVEIQYKIRDLRSIAKIEHNLKNLNLFDNVHVSEIKNETSYIAILSCSLKDVDTNEAETHK